MRQSVFTWLGLAALVLGALATPAQAAGNAIVIDGSTTVGPIAKAFAEYYMRQHPGISVTVSESGSGNGAKSLVNGTCDIADMSRFMKDTEFQAAVAAGVWPVAHVVAMDGIAIVVHPSNPVQEITVEQARAVYTGRIKNWSELGGPDRAIVVVSRDTNSGTYESFETLVLDREKMDGSVEYLGSNGAIRQKIQSTTAAIGYIGLGFVDRTVKALTVNGVEPTRETVAAGLYPVARPLFMFTNGYPDPGTPVHGFITLYLTRKGQEMIEAIGFVPVTSY
ncbi:MAG: PstS family phosphate ABC transporter substrate-binding protein [Candidatus Eisenbacteria bacterium]|uniref:Phosphate-binding protein n=1 Tax=Eiseniibacteriota bacterium TaxID=2212470 RepID=A0A937XB74_UNCEI|nr:PstS family phosphate ABC transporter substrate-binding protein [Candidatus Eisenbacteria bacterium]